MDLDLSFGRLYKIVRWILVSTISLISRVHLFKFFITIDHLRCLLRIHTLPWKRNIFLSFLFSICWIQVHFVGQLVPSISDFG